MGRRATAPLYATSEILLIPVGNGHWVRNLQGKMFNFHEIHSSRRHQETPQPTTAYRRLPQPTAGGWMDGWIGGWMDWWIARVSQGTAQPPRCHLCPPKRLIESTTRR